MKSKNSMETKINKEGGDTMAAATKITQEQIDELIRKGKANKGVLTYGDVMNLTNTLEGYSRPKMLSISMRLLHVKVWSLLMMTTPPTKIYCLW